MTFPTSEHAALASLPYLDPRSVSAMFNPACVPGSRPSAWMISAAVLVRDDGRDHPCARALGATGWRSQAQYARLFMLVTTILIVLGERDAAGGVGGRGRSGFGAWREASAWSAPFMRPPGLPVGDFITLANTYPLWIVVLGLDLGPKGTGGGATCCWIACAIHGRGAVRRPAFSSMTTWALPRSRLVGAMSTAVAMLGLHNLRGEVDLLARSSRTFLGVASLVAGSWYLLRGPGASSLRGDDGGGDGRKFSSLGGSHRADAARGSASPARSGQIFLTKAYAARRAAAGLGAGAQPGGIWVWFRISARGLRAVSPQTLVGACRFVVAANGVAPGALARGSGYRRKDAVTSASNAESIGGQCGSGEASKR